MKRTKDCFAFMNRNDSLAKVTVPVTDTRMSGHPYMKFKYILEAKNLVNLLERALITVSMVEDLYGIKLTNEEKVAASALFAFVSGVTDEIISTDMLRVMVPMRADWYTSVMFSNIRIKREIKNGMRDATVNKSTDTTMLLGSIFLESMSRFAPFVSRRSKTKLVDGHEEGIEF